VLLYCGRVDAGSAGGLYSLDDEGEDTRVVVLDLQEAQAALANGRINTATAIIALQWLLLNRDAVQARWAEPLATRHPPDSGRYPPVSKGCPHTVGDGPCRIRA